MPTAIPRVRRFSKLSDKDGMKGCRPLTEAEIEAIAAALGKNQQPARDRALFLLGLKTGFRISELLSLTLGDAFPNGKLAQMIVVARRSMKGKQEGRGVKLFNPIARAALEDLRGELAKAGYIDPDCFLFRSREGANRAISRKTAWRIITDAAAKCCIDGKLGTHCMRKTYAKNAHELLGKDLMKTQIALGHKRVTSTVSYLSFDESELDAALEKL